MLITCKPEALPPVDLIGDTTQQLEAARRYCLIAHARGANWITVRTGFGVATVSGLPVNMLEALHPQRWPA